MQKCSNVKCYASVQKVASIVNAGSTNAIYKACKNHDR